MSWGGGPVGTLSINWGDGTVDADTSFPAVHTYAAPGTYTVITSSAGAKGTGQGSTVVTVGSSVSTCTYRFVPAAPIAPSGSLAAGQGVALAVEVDQGGVPLDGAPVWLASSTRGTPDGSANRVCCTTTSTPTSLTSGPGAVRHGSRAA